MNERDPRHHDPDYMAWIAKLPCIACATLGRQTTLHRHAGVHVAHVRMADAEAGWRETGMAEKPSDRRTVPLCPRHHTDGKEAQHNMGERNFWAWLAIDPAKFCRALTGAYDSNRDGLLVVATFAGAARLERGKEGSEDVIL